MDQQAPITQASVSQPALSTSVPSMQPVNPTPPPEKKSKGYVWLIAGFVVLLIGVGIGILLRR